MFTQLKEWIGPASTQNRPVPGHTGHFNRKLQNTDNSVDILKCVAATFANCVFCPNESTVITKPAQLSGIEKDIYTELANIFKEGIPPEKLPKCPDIVTKLSEMIQSDDSTYLDIANMVNQDPSLAAKIVKVANCPLYRPKSGDVTNIQDAARLLGMDKLSAIASSVVVGQMIRISPLYHRYFSPFLWDHSQQCALACGYIAEKAGENYFNAYLIGLIHDIGKFIIFQELIKALKLAHPDTRPNPQAMSYIINQSSAQLSCMCIKQWDLPSCIQSIICEQIRQKDPAELSMMGYILFCADNISMLWLLYQNQEISLQDSQQILANHQIRPDILEEMFIEYQDAA